jgi:glyoxylate reductase
MGGPNSPRKSRDSPRLLRIGCTRRFAGATERARRDRVGPRPNVFVTRRLPGGALERLGERVDAKVWPGEGAPSPADLRREARRSQGLLCLLTDRIDAPLLDRCPDLRVISTCSVGVDHIDLAAASARGIPVGYTPGVLVETTADLAFGLLLAASRRLVDADRFVREGGWTPDRSWDPKLLLGRDLWGATLGVVGLGAIGRAVARRGQGFGMRVLGWTRSRRRVPGVEPAEFAALLEAADFISLHVALAPETRSLIDARALARMRPGAVLVNAARGGLVDEEALADALRGGRLAAAGLDVFAHEPLDPDSPLLRAPNLVLTPHIGSASVATRARMADLAVDNLLAGLERRRLLHCANAAALG